MEPRRSGDLARLGGVAALSVMLVGIGVATLPSVAQVVLSVDGEIESTAGGFRFPDGALLATAPFGASVADTGQTSCFDASGTLRTCAGTGEDAEFQAGVSWPTPRFLDNGDGTVTDHLTGLTWLLDADCPGDTLTWQEALNWMALLNGSSLACSGYAAMTFTDWRLPNANELESLLDRGHANPPLDPAHPFASVQPEAYWSSSTSTPAKDSAWIVTMTVGELSQALKSNEGRVWAVRGAL